MANNSQRTYFIMPLANGTATLFLMNNVDFDVNRSITDQFDRCTLVDNMPLVEMLELGSSLIAAAMGASRQYAERVRTTKIRGLVANAVIQPTDSLELAKWTAFTEGIDLDPTASLDTIQKSLNAREAAEQAAEAQKPLDDRQS